MNKRTVTTALFFSFLIFVLLAVTMFLTAFFALFLTRSHALYVHRRIFIISFTVSFAVTSAMIGTFLSRYTGKWPAKKILSFSNAAKEIAKGNFNIALDENIPVVELKDMAHNFNIMAKELSKAEMLSSDFIVNVSHEFKTPISAIEGYATLLQRKDLSEEKRVEYTRRILHNTSRLSRLTENILLLSKLEHQDTALTKEMYCLDEQLREAILLYEPQWTAKSISLDIELDRADYSGNRDLLAEVWQNLLGNAIKFTPQGGKIRIRLKRSISGITVSIEDNGIGMSEEVMERIYEKFYQGDTSHSTPGNGLGLSLVKKIVDLHGGTVRAASHPGKGTVFTVVLPPAPRS